MDVRHIRCRSAVHRENVVAFASIDTDLGQRGPLGLVPVLSAKDSGDAIAARVRISLQLGAEQAHRNPPRFGVLAASDVGVSGVQLADHLAQNVGQVRPVVDVGHQRRVAIPHGRPVHAVHVRNVEELAHLPPALGEDLLPLGLPVEEGLHSRQIERILDFDLAFGPVDDRVLAAGLHQHLLSIRRQPVAADGAKLRLFALLEVVQAQLGLTIAAAPPDVVEMIFHGLKTVIA